MSSWQGLALAAPSQVHLLIVVRVAIGRGKLLLGLLKVTNFTPAELASLAGVGEFLKSKKADVKIMAIEPEESPYLSLGKAGRHGIEGIGAGAHSAVLEGIVHIDTNITLY